MSREICDLLMFETITSFKPEDKMVSLKILLQERVDPKFLLKMTSSQLELLEPYIAPFKIEEVCKWCKKPGFWEWLLMPDSFKVTIEKAKEDAANAIVELLNMDMTYQKEVDSEGKEYTTTSIDPKLAMVRLKAAELLLKTDFTPKQRINNTIKVTNSIPKSMLNKSMETLEAEYRQLQEQNQ